MEGLNSKNKNKNIKGGGSERQDNIIEKYTQKLIEIYNII